MLPKEKLQGLSRHLARFNLFSSAEQIDNKALIHLLNQISNKPDPSRFEALMEMIKGLDVDYLNQPIAVVRHEVVDSERALPPLWSPRKTVRTYDTSLWHSANRRAPYTTLANIIATNELNFTALEMAHLMRLLIDKGVNFSAVDHSAYSDLISNASYNNPLKSLLAASYDCPAIHELIDDLLAYLAENPEHNELIFNNLDHFEFGAMTPAQFMLRIGREDWALVAYRQGAIPSQEDFLLCCASLGTTRYHRQAHECLSYILARSEFSLSDYQTGINYLQVATPDAFEARRLGILHVLKTESLQEEHLLSRTFCDAQNASGLTMTSFREACQQLSCDEIPDYIDAIALERIYNASLADGKFSDYYRVESTQDLARHKYELLSHDEHASARLAQVIQEMMARKDNQAGLHEGEDPSPLVTKPKGL